MVSLESGTYVITNARFLNVAILPNANDHSDVVGGPEESDLHCKWDVSCLKNKKYVIKNRTLHRFASSGPRTTERDPIYGGKRKQEWIIRETNFGGQYIISTTDTNLIWGLSDGESNTPLALADVPSDPRNQWMFSPVVDNPQRQPNSVQSRGQVVTAYETPHMLQTNHSASADQHGSIRANSSAPCPPLPTSDAHVYIRNLIKQGNGCPLYIPEPYGNSPLYRTKGVRIGDVGFVTDDGHFKALFNVRASVYDPINRRGVPDGFEQIDLHKDDFEVFPNYFKPERIVASVTTTCGVLGPDTPPGARPPAVVNGHRLIWNTSEGAVLHLPHGATRLRCDPRLFRDQAIRNGYNWYKYAWQTRGYDVRNGALCLVTGTDKTDTWMVGAFSQIPPGNQVQLSIAAIHENLPCSYSWIGTNPATRLSECHPVTNDIAVDRADMEQDDAVFLPDAPGGLTHSVFVRGFRISLRKSLWALLSGNPLPAELSFIQMSAPEDFAGGHDRDDSHGVFSSVFSTWGWGGNNTGGEGRQQMFSSESSPQPINEEATVVHIPTAEPADPAMVINDLLLNLVPEAQVAVIHDDELHSLIQEDHVDFPDSSELVTRLNRKYTLDVINGCVSLLPIEGSLHRSSSEGSFPFSHHSLEFDEGSPSNVTSSLVPVSRTLLAAKPLDNKSITKGISAKFGIQSKNDTHRPYSCSACGNNFDTISGLISHELSCDTYPCTDMTFLKSVGERPKRRSHQFSQTLSSAFLNQIFELEAPPDYTP